MALPPKQATLIAGHLPKQLWRLTLPTIGGIFAITIFNITDTFFVSRLGTEALAAMGFTFPIVMCVGSFAMGIPNATTYLITPLTRGLLTRIAATTGGTTGVAAFAAATRIKSFLFIIPACSTASASARSWLDH